MKTTLGISACVALVLLISPACKDDAPTPPPMPTGKITAAVGGKTWEASGKGTILHGLLKLNGQADDGTLIHLVLDEVAERNFNSQVATTNTVAYFPAISLGDNALLSTTGLAHGSVNITELNWADSTVSGTFSAFLQHPESGDTLSILQGKIDGVPFSQETRNFGVNEITVNIDGSPWEATYTSASGTGAILYITGGDVADSRALVLVVPKAINPGTYPIGSTLSLDSMQAGYNADRSHKLVAHSGQITVDQHDKTNKILNGTFQFQAAPASGTPVVTIGNGTFYVRY